MESAQGVPHMSTELRVHVTHPGEPAAARAEVGA